MVVAPPGRQRLARALVAREALPGLTWVVALVAAAYGMSHVVPSVSAPIWAFGLSLLVGPPLRARAMPVAGLRLAARTPLRVGVALLGLSVVPAQLVSIGVAGVAVAAATVVATLLGTVALGRRLGLGGDLPLLIGTGSAICGASAIAAMESVAGSREEDAGYALVTVTLFGTVAMIATPLVARHGLGLDADASGLWLGASIHEVAQVAGAGAALSPAALQVAVLTKLLRVVLLAPTVACVAALRGGRRSRVGVPGFVLAFLGLVALRGVAELPTGLVDAGQTASLLLLSAGLAALGAQIELRRLAAAGSRPLLLGLAAWLIASATSLLLVVALV